MKRLCPSARAVAGAAVMAALALPAAATTLNVPSQYATLGAALTAAQSADIIQVAAGSYTANLSIGKSITIQGAGSGSTVINGNALDAVVSVGPDYSVVLRDLTLTNGHTPSTFDHGGAVFNEGTLRMERCVLSESFALGGGGGVSNYRDATLVDCYIYNCSTNGSGGGVENEDNLTMINCSVLNNTSNLGGGCANNGALSLTNCTLYGNATGQGGAVFNNSGSVTLYYTTIYKNSASVSGGGVVGLDATTTRGTIIAGNTAPAGPDVDGALTSQGHNIIGTTKDASISLASGATGDQTGTGATGIDPKLQASPQSNGGYTPTLLPLAGGIALDKGDPTNYPATDQRGIVRPQDGDANGSYLPDVGAVEAQTAFAVSDASAALRISAGLTAATLNTRNRYDVNPVPGDGIVTVRDVLRILRKVRGIDTPNP